MAKKARWWAADESERFWLESTDRLDIGSDLHAPLLDESGGENWRYGLFREARPGDVVFHYDKRRHAITSRSTIGGPARPHRVTWAARGSYARTRGAIPREMDGYTIPLRSPTPLEQPLTLGQLRLAQSDLVRIVETLNERHGPPLYFPFELAKRPTRPLQGYAFKLPAAFVTAFPQLEGPRRGRGAENGPAADWTDAELQACVDVYFDLLARQEKRDHPNYTQVLRDVSQQLGRRSKGAVDRRMQTISLFLKDRNEPTVARFPSGQGLSSGIAQRLREIIEARLPTSNPAELERRVARGRSKPVLKPSSGSGSAPSEEATVRRFKRRADVKLWVLTEAADNCEACGSTAPFRDSEGRPFLEVHHIRPLAEGGPDSTCNAIALCPNCHRRLHHSGDREAFRLELIGRIDRIRDHPRQPLDACDPASI